MLPPKAVLMLISSPSPPSITPSPSTMEKAVWVIMPTGSCICLMKEQIDSPRTC